jgi:hypothetical protein
MSNTCGCHHESWNRLLPPGPRFRQVDNRCAQK